MTTEANTQPGLAATATATETAGVDIPVYETHSSNHHILIRDEVRSTKDHEVARQPLVFRGAHRGFGAIRLDYATLYPSFSDIIGDDSAEDSPGVVKARAMATKIIESTPEFQRGKKHTELLGKPGAIWKQSDLAEVMSDKQWVVMKSLVAMFDKAKCLSEAKRRKLSVRQQKDKEEPAEYLKYLQDLVFTDMSGGAVAGPAGANVTQISRGAETRPAGGAN